MTSFQVATLLVGLYVLFEIFALMLSASIGKRVSKFRYTVFMLALLVLGFNSFLLLTGRA